MSLAAENCDFLDNPLNGQVSFTSTSIGSIASYTCSPGFRLTGVNTRECLQERVWSGIEPICERTCNFSMQLCMHFFFNYNHTSTLFKRINMQYKNALAHCFICYQLFIFIGIECSSLDAPQYGSVATSAGYNVGSIATYSCNPDFVLSDSTTRECLPNGEWSGFAPICRGTFVTV